MSSESLHAPRDRLSKETLALHHAFVSLIEELAARVASRPSRAKA